MRRKKLKQKIRKLEQKIQIQLMMLLQRRANIYAPPRVGGGGGKWAGSGLGLFWSVSNVGYVSVTKPDGFFNGSEDPREYMARRMDATALDMREAIEQSRKEGPE